MNKYLEKIASRFKPYKSSDEAISAAMSVKDHVTAINSYRQSKSKNKNKKPRSLK